jgi:hypothetical protein
MNGQEAEKQRSTVKEHLEVGVKKVMQGKEEETNANHNGT